MNSPLAPAVRRREPAPPGTSPARPAEAARGAIDGGSTLIRTARVFATRCHARQRRDSDGAPFIEHPLEVARLLRDAACSDVVVAAGLLHDVLETTSVGVDELTACFGAEVAALVRAVSDDGLTGGYRERKQRLREQVRRTGGDAAVVYAADKVSKVRELNAVVPGAGAAGGRDGRGDARREHVRRQQIEHYRESLEMLRGVAPHHPLVRRLTDELDGCRLAQARSLSTASSA